METRQIKVSLIETDPNQPRKTVTEEYLMSLGASIKAEGLQSPITVRQHPKDAEKFMIVFGECRYRASVMAGLETTDAFVKEYDTDKDVFLSQIVENTARENLLPMEQADSFRQAMLYGISIEDLAERTGKSVSTIAADVEMSAIKDPLVRKMINAGFCPKAVGRELAKFPDAKIRTAWDWASKKTTVKGMLNQLDAYRQKDGQQTFGYDYTQKKDVFKAELKNAAVAFERWEKSTNSFMERINKNAVKLEHAVHARSKDLEKIGMFAKDVKKLAEMLIEQIGACDSKINGKQAVVVNA